MFIGVLLPSLFGAFTALTFANPTDSYIDDLVTASPAWYVLPIVVISLFGGMSQGVLCIYASGLDLEGLAPRLKRTQTTIITAAVAIGLLYIGVFVFDAVDSVTAMTIALNAVITPWVAILAIGALRTKTYDPVDLQAFAHGRRGGQYWFTGGWNLPAVIAWTVGATFGLLTVNTTLYVGPLADIAGGVDLSTIGSAALAGLIYVASLTVSSRHDTLSRRTGDRILQEVGLARPEELAGYFTEDGVYHNIPMDPVQGPEAIKQFIAGFTAAFDGIDFQVHRQVSDGNLVMNERTDVMRRKDGKPPIKLPVTGVFEIERRQDQGLAGLLRHGHRHEPDDLGQQSDRAVAARRSESRTSPRRVAVSSVVVNAVPDNRIRHVARAEL